MLERVVISRRTGVQELDLLLMLEEDAPEAERARPVWLARINPATRGEASPQELALAVAEWLDTVRDRMDGHDRFQWAVARNALRIVAREHLGVLQVAKDFDLALALLDGEKSLNTPSVLSELRRRALVKLAIDIPKYPALRHALNKWTGVE